MVCLGNRDHSVVFEIASKYCISDSFVDYDGYSFSSKAFLPTVVDKMVIWVKFTYLVHFSLLIPKTSLFSLAISCLTTSTLLWFMVPGSYAILFFSASDFTSITSHIHNWALFSFWLCLFIPSGVISPLFSSSILSTYWPGQFIFHCPVFVPFHTVHGVVKARILKWFAIPSSSGPHFVRILHIDLSTLHGPAV